LARKHGATTRSRCVSLCRWRHRHGLGLRHPHL
jgi:hypothetical protein